MPALLLRLPGDVPVVLDREAAREAVRRELSKPEYQVDRPGLVERGIDWLRQSIGDLLDAVPGGPGGWPGVVVLLVLLVLAAVALRLRLGPVARSAAARDGALFAGRPRSAAEHRADADTAAAEGRWSDAVRERMRAVVRDLEERHLLEPRPGRTAAESAAEGAAVLPDLAGPLGAGARLFDEVVYGDREATATHDGELRRLDEAVRVARVGART